MLRIPRKLILPRAAATQRITDHFLANIRLISQAAHDHPNVQALRKERERLRNTPTGILNIVSADGVPFGDQEAEIAKVLDENMWKFIPLINFDKIKHAKQPIDYFRKSQPEKYFISQQRAEYLKRFLFKKVVNSFTEGFAVTGPNGVGKSELVLCWLSMCFAADLPVLYVVRHTFLNIFFLFLFLI